MAAKDGVRDNTITTRIRKRLGGRMREAFSFLVATAWIEFFNELFRIVAGDNTHILKRLLHAMMFTLLAVTVAIFSESDDEKGGDYM